MHSRATVEEALRLRDEEGLGARRVARRLGLALPTVRDWHAGRLPRYARLSSSGGSYPDTCSACGQPHRLDELSQAYVHLLGLYLGDGTISVHRRGVHRLRISLDKKYPQIVDDCAKSIQDHFAFENLREIVVNSRFIEPEPEMDGADIADLHRAFTRLYCAVPFSEAERGWLLGGASSAPYTAEDLVDATAEIMSSGVRQAVHGRDLVRRWWAWRRGTQEYAAQDSLEGAKLTLGGLGRTLVIEQNRTAEQAAILRRSGH